MGVDLRTPKIDFAHLMEKIQPMAVSQFVVWLDEKISEFKVLGSMDLDERMDAPKWIKDYSMSVMVSGISSHGPPEESQSAPKRQRVSTDSPRPSHNFRHELDRRARVRTMEPPPVRKRNIIEMPESRAPREEDTSDLDFVDIKKEMLDEDDDISVIGASIPLASGPRDLGSPASRSSRSFSSSSSPTSIHPASINTKGTIDMPTRSPKRSHSSESSVVPVSLIQNTSFSQSPSSSSRVPLLPLTPEISSLVQSATDDNSVSLSMAHSPSNLQLAIPSASKSEPDDDDDDDLQMSMESYGDSADNLPEDWQQYAQLQDSSLMEGEDPGPSGSQQYIQSLLSLLTPCLQVQRKRLTINEKKEICLFKAQYPSASQSNIAQYFSRKWSYPIARETIRNILRNSQVIISRQSEPELPSMSLSNLALMASHARAQSDTE